MNTLQLRDGGHLTYLDSGTGRPIVLLHGWGMQAKFFGAQISALSGDFRVIAPDLRGHGHSSAVTQVHDFATLVEDINELLVALDLTNVLVVGWSMGAMITWNLALGPHEARISALVTIDMVPRLLNDADWKFGLRDGASSSEFTPVAARMVDDWLEFTRFFVPRIFARGCADQRRELADWIIKDTAQNHPESMARLWLSMTDQDLRNQLAKIDKPTLVVSGALSQLYTDAANQWVVNQMPNATRVDFVNSGHAPNLEEPDRFNRELQKFANENS